MIKVLVTIEDEDGHIWEWSDIFMTQNDLDEVSLGDVFAEAEELDDYVDELEEWAEDMGGEDE